MGFETRARHLTHTQIGIRRIVDFRWFAVRLPSCHLTPPGGRSPTHRPTLPRLRLNGAQQLDSPRLLTWVVTGSSKNQTFSVLAHLLVVRAAASLCFCWPPLRITQDEVFSNLLACPKALGAGGTSVILKCHLFWPGFIGNRGNA